MWISDGGEDPRLLSLTHPKGSGKEAFAVFCKEGSFWPHRGNCLPCAGASLSAAWIHLFNPYRFVRLSEVGSETQ